MLYLGPKVSSLFSCMWCKSGNHMRGPNTPYFTPSSLFTLICPTFTLNTDYKIMAKILANRFKTVLPEIIKDDQTGYLKGRYIGQNIHLLEDITFYTKMPKVPAIILSIDYEIGTWCLKLENKYLGDSFINYVKTMYNNIEVTVINNGITSVYFKLERGVRQGCPLPPYLFFKLSLKP